MNFTFFYSCGVLRDADACGSVEAMFLKTMGLSNFHLQHRSKHLEKISPAEQKHLTSCPEKIPLLPHDGTQMVGNVISAIEERRRLHSRVLWGGIKLLGKELPTKGYKRLRMMG